MKKLVPVALVFFLLMCLAPSALANWTGGHDVMGIPQAKTAWYFAEGCSRNGFNTWICLYNPNSSGTTAHVNYYLENGEVRAITQDVPANSRRTVDVCSTCKGEHDIASSVKSSLPLVAERSVYFDHNNITGGHVAMGVEAPQRTWYFAEGCTQPGFTEWLCILNSNNYSLGLKVHYLIEGGEVIVKDKTVGPNSRFTQNVVDDIGPNKNVSIQVVGNSDSAKTICERPMYFTYKPGQLNWTGGHDSPGATQLSAKWLFAEGCTRAGFETWLTLQNPGTKPVTSKVTYMMQGGVGNVVKSVSIPAQTRLTIDVGAAVGPEKDVSIEVDSSAPIAAERPMYFMYHGAWDGGSDSYGVPTANTTSLFAEGCSRAGFESWVCVQNPNSTPADIVISFAEASGQVVQHSTTIPALTRATFSANTVTGPEQDFAIKVTSNKPVVAERPMYFDYQGHFVASATMTVRFLNVGEGDSCVIKSDNNGETFFALVDTGKSSASSTVISGLQAMGCSAINVLVLTHPDADHTGSAVSVLNAFPVKEEWDPGVDGDNTATWQQVKATLAAKGIARKRPQAGQVYSWNGIQTTVLNPGTTTYPETNDNSIVLVESIGAEDVMLTGDAQSGAQQFMMSENWPQIEVFKAPHHGADSGYYAPFVDKVHPANSVISVGPNSYGHPSTAVLAALAAFGPVYRTDQNGDVTVTATPSALAISCQNSLGWEMDLG